MTTLFSTTRGTITVSQEVNGETISQTYQGYTPTQARKLFVRYLEAKKILDQRYKSAAATTSVQA